MRDLGEIDGFDGDEANRDKNWFRHRVTPLECEEVFFNLPLLLQADAPHSEREIRYFVLGKTNQERLLFIAFSLRRKKIRVISARNMSKKERDLYAKTTSRI
jgi:hypothetical protein